jgi:hypothetical protein
VRRLDAALDVCLDFWIEGGNYNGVESKAVSGSVLGGGQPMIDPKEFADKQLELAGEFAQYVADHPEVDQLLPENSHIYFQIKGEADFNRYSREMAERQRREQGAPLILVRIKGLAPPHSSRLIDPVIEPASAVA